MSLPLAVVGVSHETAPVSVRERMAFGPSEVEGALQALRADSGVEEAVLLSTCNRTEVYLFPAREERTVRAAERLLAAKAGSSVGPVSGYLFHVEGEEAVRHLFRVSSGLDSLVTGEAEIQGQVREAYQRASAPSIQPPMAGPVLNRLFQMALSVGGRVRSETSIGEGSASVASVAVELARKIFGSLKGKRTLILGAGQTGELIAEALTREGVEGTVVANRTYDRAVSLARKHRGLAIPFDQMHTALESVDIVLTSTAAPHPVITRSIVRDSFVEPRRSPLLIIDIAIPRDVDPSVGDEAGVFLYNVDDLRKIVDEHVRVREGALPAAQEIIAETSEEFRAWYASLEVVPVIQWMRRQGDAVRDAELERVLKALPHLSADDRLRIEEFARRLQNKLLHEPTARLRKGMSEGRGAELIDAVRFLYGPESRPERGGDREGPSVGPGPDASEPAPDPLDRSSGTERERGAGNER